MFTKCPLKASSVEQMRSHFFLVFSYILGLNSEVTAAALRAVWVFEGKTNNRNIIALFREAKHRYMFTKRA